MEKYDTIWWIILVFSIVPYTPLIIGLVKQENDKSQTFLTWFLYLTLDCITLFSGAKERINIDPMVFGFSIGSLIMTSILIYQKRIAILGKIEIITIILIIICIIIWFSTNSYLALISSVVSESIVGIYLIKRTCKNPVVDYNLIGYIMFLIISIISIIFTAEWNFSEVGFAISETILNFIILIPLLKKWKEEKISA